MTEYEWAIIHISMDVRAQDIAAQWRKFLLSARSMNLLGAWLSTAECSACTLVSLKLCINIDSSVQRMHHFIMHHMRHVHHYRTMWSVYMWNFRADTNVEMLLLMLTDCYFLVFRQDKNHFQPEWGIDVARQSLAPIFATKVTGTFLTFTRQFFLVGIKSALNSTVFFSRALNRIKYIFQVVLHIH